MYYGFHKNIKQRNIDHNTKCLLSILECFLKEHVTLTIVAMATDN